MKRIKRLELKNFECHVDSSLDFVPGVNVLTGLSDHGKSSIRRAIEWVFFNRPNNTSMLRKKGITRVIMTLDDDTVIERFRSKSKNGYKLNGEVFTALRRDVPEEVKAVLGVTNTNVQPQRELYFLLDLPSGRVAKKLNKVTNLETADSALKAASDRLRKNKTSMKATEERIDYLTTTLSGLQWVDEASGLLKTYDQLSERQQELRFRYQEIHSTLTKVKGLQTVLERLEYLDRAHDLLGTLDTLLEQSNETRRKFDAIQHSVMAVQSASATLNNLQYLDSAEVLAAKIDNSYKRVSDLKERYRQLHQLVYTIKRLSAIIEKVNKEEELLDLTNKAVNRLESVYARYQDIKKITLTIQVCRGFLEKLMPETALEDVHNLEESLGKATDIHSEISKLSSAIRRVQTAVKAVQRADSLLSKSQADFNNFMAEIEVCPLCGHSKRSH